MAAFAVLFGTRHTDATEHQDGLMLAIATESIVKLVAFLAVGIFVTFAMFPGPLTLFSAPRRAETAAVLTRVPPATSFCAMTLLSLFAIVLLPRQFHVGIVENRREAEIRRCRLAVPVYGAHQSVRAADRDGRPADVPRKGDADRDMFVLALPLRAHSELFTLIAFVGGLSAATAMVIVESVALAIMVSNDIVVPLMLKRRADLGRPERRRRAASDGAPHRDLLPSCFLPTSIIAPPARRGWRRSGCCRFAAVAELTQPFHGGLPSSSAAPRPAPSAA